MKRNWLRVGLCTALFLAGGTSLLCAELFDLHPAWQFLILWATSMIFGNALYYGIRRSTRGLLALTHAYAARRFDMRFPIAEWDVLSQFGSALQAMAQQISSSEQELFRRMRFESELARFLQPTVAAQIASGQLSLLLNGQRCVVSVIFIDLVGFNGFADTAPPIHVVSLLQEVVTLTTELVFRHSGVLDKSVGDCVMAVFGAPGSLRDHAQRAVCAAEDIKRFIQASASRWQRLYSFDVQLAIGISTGEAVVGDLGSETRLEYSAVGDVVTIAARLAALARPGQILLTAEVAACTSASFDYNSLGEHALFGGRAPVRVLELS